MKIIIKRLLIVMLFLVVAIILFDKAPEYELEYKYKDGDIRVIINDTEITRNINKLPQAAILVEGEVMLSQDTIDILFDKNLYYEEKYETLITTSKEHRADLKVDSRVITIDDKTQNLKVPPIKVRYNYSDDDRYDEKKQKSAYKEVIYIPVKALEEVYDMVVEFNDKVIITENNENRIRIIVNEGDSIELKHTEDNFSKNVEIIEAGNYIDIYNYDETKDFIYARSYTGELGYINKVEFNNYLLMPTITKKEKKPLEKLNIAWDYINPEATSIGEKSNRKKVEALDVVAPTLLYLKNTKGDIRYNSNVVNSYLKWAKKQGYKVWVTLKNEYANRHFTLDETSEFLNDMEHRKNTINELIKFAKDNDIDGINVDLELIYQDDATAFSQFIRELSVKGAQNDVVISVCVNIPDGSSNWSLCYQHKALSEYADYLALMTYDQYGASSSIAGPNASLDWVNSNLEKLVNRDNVDSEKILLGIPFYSRLWKSEKGKLKSSTLYMNGAKAYLNKEIEAVWLEDAGQYFYENSSGTAQVWIEENKSIAKKLELVEKYNLGGTAYWMLGYETEDIWNTISENLNY